MKQIKSLDDLMGGALLERFRKEFTAIQQNIHDPNTEATAARTITIKLTIKPDKSRASGKLYLDTTSNPAKVASHEVNVVFHRNDKGEVAAAEFGADALPGQIDVEDINLETGEVTANNAVPIEFGRKKAAQQ